MRLDTLKLDLRHALRSLRAAGNRAFAVASIATLALAIAAVTAIVSIAYGMLFAPLPYENADRVVRAFERNPSRGLPEFSVSGPNFESWRERSQSFASLAAVTSEVANVGLAGETQRYDVVSVTPSFWSVIGMKPIAGRAFDDAEAVFPGAPVALIGERLAAERFGGAARAVGQSILINGANREIVGVVPQDVGFATNLDLWVPLAMDPEVYTRGDRRLEVLGRLREGVTLDAARAELASITASLAAEFREENAGWEGAIEPVRDWIVGAAARDRITTLLAAVIVLMLVAASNVGSLQLARATRRTREMGVRQALGAGRARLLRQLVVENLTLVAIASIIGVALAAFAMQVAVASLPVETPRLAHLVLNPGVALGAVAFAALLTLAFGLLPTFVATRGVPLTSSLSQGGRTTVDAGRVSLRQALVVAQFTLSTVLLVGAVLLAQELMRMRDATLGFAADRLLVARLTMPADTNDQYDAAAQTYAALLEKIEALPGVESAGIASEIPLGSFDTSFDIAAGTGKLTQADAATNAAWRVVSGDFLSTLGVPLQRGRTFARDDESPRSMILSAGLAKKLFGDADPIGQSVKLGNGRNATIVGVAGDVLQRDLAEAPTPTMYLPTTWILLPTMTVAIRTSGDPAALAPAVRGAAREVAPMHPLFDLGTMRSVVDSSIAQPKLQTAVLVAFAVASLTLAAIGIAGLLAFLVASRTPELALRLALGAPARRVTGLVLSRGGALCAIGLALGAILSVALIGHFRASVGDASVVQALAIAAALLATVAFFACWLPARRVSRIQPSLALRGE